MKGSAAAAAIAAAMVGLAGASSPDGAQAGSLSAHWVARVPNGDGTFRETVFVLTAQGDTLTGRVITPTAETPIVDGHISGDGSFVFATLSGRPPNESRTGYTGTVVSRDQVRIQSARPNRPPQEFAAERAPDTAGVLPARVDPPALHHVRDNGLARTPPMGWNSWNHFRGRVDDATVRAMADAIVATGMQRAGYTYVNVDDTWEAGRDAAGRILTNRKFPDMKALADYVHAKGLQLGIYSSPGPLTCAGYEGSYGHEIDDARTYAAWGIDYLKYDWCSAGRLYADTDMQAVYQKMGDALLSTGRPIVFSLCQYGRQDVWKWGAEVGGNLWRTTGDISDTWVSMSRIGFSQEPLAPYAAPGHWNDPDMLEIGNGGMTETEYRTHMSLWALLAAPLLAGNDLRNVSPEILRILTNEEVIAIDQDLLGRQARRVKQDGDLETWTRSLEGGDVAVGLFNRGTTPAQMTIRCDELQMCGAYTLRDVWSHQDLGRFGPEYATSIPAHGVVLLRAAAGAPGPKP